MAQQPPSCNKGTRSRRNCYPQWDNFPCWVKEEMACYNINGDTQLFDPLADIMRSLSYVVEYVNNAFLTTITDLPVSQREETRSHYFEFLNDYITTIQPIQNNALRNLDMVRYYNADQYLGMAEEYVNRLGNVIRGLRQQGNMGQAVESLQLNNPNRIERQNSVDVDYMGGKKKKYKKKKSKRKKTRKLRNKKKII